MNRVFEYEGLRALLTNKAVRDELADYMCNPQKHFADVCDYLMQVGLECYQQDDLSLVIYVHRTPRKKPACAVVGYRPADKARSTYAGGTYVVSLFEAGDFDVAGAG